MSIDLLDPNKWTGRTYPLGAMRNQKSLFGDRAQQPKFSVAELIAISPRAGYVALGKVGDHFRVVGCDPTEAITKTAKGAYLAHFGPFTGTASKLSKRNDSDDEPPEDDDGVVDLCDFAPPAVERYPVWHSGDSHALCPSCRYPVLMHVDMAVLSERYNAVQDILPFVQKREYCSNDLSAAFRDEYFPLLFALSQFPLLFHLVEKPTALKHVDYSALKAMQHLVETRLRARDAGYDMPLKELTACVVHAFVPNLRGRPPGLENFTLSFPVLSTDRAYSVREYVKACLFPESSIANIVGALSSLALYADIATHYNGVPLGWNLEPQTEQRLRKRTFAPRVSVEETVKVLGGSASLVHRNSQPGGRMAASVIEDYMVVFPLGRNGLKRDSFGSQKNVPGVHAIACWPGEYESHRKLLSLLGRYQQHSPSTSACEKITCVQLPGSDATHPLSVNGKKVVEAMASNSRIIFVNAPGGAGKSTLLAFLMGKLLKDDPTKTVLCLSAYNAVAAEMARQFRKFGVASAQIEARVCHYFRHNGSLSDVTHTFVVMDEATLLPNEDISEVLRNISPDSRLVLMGDKSQCMGPGCSGGFELLMRAATSGSSTVAVVDYRNENHRVKNQTLASVLMMMRDAVVSPSTTVRLSLMFSEHDMGMCSQSFGMRGLDMLGTVVPWERLMQRETRAVCLVNKDAAEINARILEAAVHCIPSGEQTLAGKWLGLGSMGDGAPFLLMDKKLPFIQIANSAWQGSIGPGGEQKGDDGAVEERGPEGPGQSSKFVSFPKGSLLRSHGYVGESIGKKKRKVRVTDRRGVRFILTITRRQLRDGAIMPAAALPLSRAQGLAWDHVVVVFPDTDCSPRLTPNALYTAVSRARHSVVQVHHGKNFGNSNGATERNPKGLLHIFDQTVQWGNLVSTISPIDLVCGLRATHRGVDVYPVRLLFMELTDILLRMECMMGAVTTAVHCIIDYAFARDGYFKDPRDNKPLEMRDDHGRVLMCGELVMYCPALTTQEYEDPLDDSTYATEADLENRRASILFPAAVPVNELLQSACAYEDDDSDQSSGSGEAEFDFSDIDDQDLYHSLDAFPSAAQPQSGPEEAMPMSPRTQLVRSDSDSDQPDRQRPRVSSHRGRVRRKLMRKRQSEFGNLLPGQDWFRLYTRPPPKEADELVPNQSVISSSSLN